MFNIFLCLFNLYSAVRSPGTLHEFSQWGPSIHCMKLKLNKQKLSLYDYQFTEDKYYYDSSH